ncbi:MAG TPA: hypothetical protein VNY06_08865, partial [Methylocella sp.]|nr:hypothetical protein [Methylocella sp.]
MIGVPRRDHRLDTALCQVVANLIAVVALVAEKLVGTRVVKGPERGEALRLVNLAARNIEGQRVAFGIRAEVDFGREAAARAAERFMCRPQTSARSSRTLRLSAARSGASAP